MKNIIPFLGFLLLQFQVNAIELARFTECADPAANVVYQQLPTGDSLFVTAINQNNGLMEKIQLEDFKIVQDKAIFLEKREILSCDEDAAKVEEELNFRKIKILNNAGTVFTRNIVGLSEDGMFIPVDYLCKTTIISQCN